jgi:hypothetical protein
MRFLRLNCQNRRGGYNTTTAATVGNAIQAEYCRNVIPNAEVNTRFVGFDETRNAETKLATWK